MGKDNLLHLRNTLLQGGVAYKHVRRFIAELKDHYEDLEKDALKNGISKQDARDLADNRLGEPEFLVNEMLARSELKSLGYRYPKALLVIGPVFTVVVFSIMLAFLIAGVIVGFNLVFKGAEMTEQIVALPGWVIMLLSSIRLFWMYLLPLLIIAMFINYAEKNCLSLKYYGLGLFMACLIACSQYVYFIWPDPANNIKGEFSVSLVISELHFPADYFLRLASCLLLALGVKYKISQKMQSEFE